MKEAEILQRVYNKDTCLRVGECTVGFYNQSNMYPITFQSPIKAISIANTSDTNLSFTVICCDGESITGSVPSCCDFDGTFKDIVSLSISGDRFDCEVRR